MIEVFYVMAFTVAVMAALISLARWQHRTDENKKFAKFEMFSSPSQREPEND